MQPEQPSRPGSAAPGMKSSAADAPEIQALLARLQPKTENGVTYVCGGVGAEEERYMKGQSGKYDMMVTFAARDGEALADVNVDIADAKGNSVLKTTCGGPIMLVDMPQPGDYRVTADASGYKQGQMVSVKGGESQMVALAWPTKVARIHTAIEETATGSSGAPGAGAAGTDGGGRSAEPYGK